LIPFPEAIMAGSPPPPTIPLLKGWSSRVRSAMFFACYLIAWVQFLRIELPINDDHQASDQSRPA
jgi:hypothetical protein